MFVLAMARSGIGWLYLAWLNTLVFSIDSLEQCSVVQSQPRLVQYSPKTNRLDWGGIIIRRNHTTTTTPYHTTLCLIVFAQYREVSSNEVGTD